MGRYNTEHHHQYQNDGVLANKTVYQHQYQIDGVSSGVETRLCTIIITRAMVFHPNKINTVYYHRYQSDDV
ncbi:hypothetical protein RRG08_067018 [Elysia crispata]|uniref:Uncharacterized protein n=1 Tax=Elysia crispata TaxID=231223 RepID=A0AAE1A3H2_9GAST|nr:hypothetical protein RRG08_067018 [Elysia crispata]